MIAPDCLAHLSHRRPPELPAEDHQRLFQQTTLLEVFDERRRGAVNRQSNLVELFIEVVLPVAVMVPTGLVELHESHPSLDHASRQKAVVCERLLAGLRSVEVQSRLALSGEIHQFGSTRLHAIGHFVRRDPSADLRVPDLRQTRQIQVTDRVQLRCLTLHRNAARS